ncbi:MAG: serine/threonine-protein phosphatase, partial [Selenomonadaceae bacterium]|nr:serine/threonine-protein phosphatase [Selenomonadaceae bacterium]
GGHNPPLVCRNGKFDYLPTEKQNTVLGLFDSETYQECCLTLAPGDMIFLYTDGVTEAMNEARELYSEERLQRTLNEQSGKNIKDILTAVRENVSIYAGNAEQSDDITMLGLKFNGKFGGT